MWSRAIPIVLMAALLTACATSPTPPSTKSAPSPEPITPLAPEVAEENYQRALGYLREGGDRKAERLLRELAASNPERYNARLNLALIYQRTERPQEAFNILEPLLKDAPGNPVAHHLMGIVQRELRHFSQAEVAYREAIRLDPNYALAHLNLAILLELYYQDLSQALIHYERYRELVEKIDPQISAWIADVERRIAAQQDRSR